MQDDPDNVVRFRPRPKARPAPNKPVRQLRQTRQAGGGRAGGHEPPINWSRAPIFLVAVAAVFALMWGIGAVGRWIGGLGFG